MDDAGDVMPIAELLDERRHLLDVARRLLGRSNEAENVIEEIYRQWYELPETARADIASPRAWLVKTVADICLARPARTEGPHEAGPAPTPVERTDPTPDDEVSQVLLSVLQALPPAERAAFVLTDVVRAAHDTVNDAVDRAEPEYVELIDHPCCSLPGARSRPATLRQHDAVARALRAACVAEDAVLLESMLCPHATAVFDGGGKVRTRVRSVRGPQQVARSLLTVLGPHPRTTVAAQSVTGRTGMVVRYEQRVVAVISLDVAGDRVAHVWAVLNPDKLRRWNQPIDRTTPL
ncbi:sigma factor [Streptomyces sp. PA03-2a]|uniref:sigma factor n=1 Tax=Streptomyces sp. PA03-2a TaxID=3028701 RepID=UPI0029A93757|nr:sigma factor [Streptomyces sp. PA03-2a]MDX2733267.1 sigma factor [Streptomyces sp. PA03-2a]